jgi:hypothetical protein
MSDDRDNQGKSVCEQTEPVPMQPGVPQLVLIHKRLPHDADRYAWTPFMAAHPCRRLVAFSEEADEFWSSLCWDRFDHPDGPTFYRPLFVQPARA